MKSIVLACVLLMSGSTFAAEYMCRLANGKTMVSGSPCPADAKTTYSNTRPNASQDEHDARRKIRDDRASAAAEKRDEERRQMAAAAEVAERNRQAQLEANQQWAKEQRELQMIQELQETRHEASRARAAAEATAAANSQRKKSMFCTNDGIGNMYCN
jgi:hypothetical protein